MACPVLQFIRPFIFLIALNSTAVARSEVSIVCAQGVWCGIAQQIAGPWGHTISLLNDPRIDPHAFQASPKISRQLATADIVVATGAHYDDWINPLLAAQKNEKRHFILVSVCANKAEGVNPHLFYDVASVRAYAYCLTDALIALVPTVRNDLTQRRQAFLQDVKSVAQLEARLRTRLDGQIIAVSEPIGGYLFDALGLKIADQGFAHAAMTGTEPVPHDLADLEASLKSHRAHFYVSNPNVSGPLQNRARNIAQHAGVPIVTLPEFFPENETWQSWMHNRLAVIARVAM